MPVIALIHGGIKSLAEPESRDYAEPLFVFVMMVVAGSGQCR